MLAYFLSHPLNEKMDIIIDTSLGFSTLILSRTPIAKLEYLQFKFKLIRLGKEIAR